MTTYAQITHKDPQEAGDSSVCWGSFRTCFNENNNLHVITPPRASDRNTQLKYMEILCFLKLV